MQAAMSLRAAAASAVQGSRQLGQRSLAGRQLCRAASNGARCRAFFKFGQKSTDSKDGSMDAASSSDSAYFRGEKRNDYTAEDVQDYFMYMGMLASEGNYDRCEAMLASGTAPVDLLLLMAASEGDDGKVDELLQAGADPTVRDLDGRTALELAKKDEVKELLNKVLAKA